MTLYEIDRAVRDVLENGYSVDAETGEILYDDTDLDQLQMDLEQKIENIGIYVKNLRAEADAIKNEEAALKRRRERKTNLADHYAEYVKAYMLNDARMKFETVRVQMSIRRSEAVEIDPLAHLPEEFLVEKVEVKPDKTKLKKAIKGGEVIEGARLVENQNITIK